MPHRIQVGDAAQTARARGLSQETAGGGATRAACARPRKEPYRRAAVRRLHREPQRGNVNLLTNSSYRNCADCRSLRSVDGGSFWRLSNTEFQLTSLTICGGLSDN